MAFLTGQANIDNEVEILKSFSLLKEALEKKVDIVVGNRMNQLHGMPFHRILSNKITS